MRSPAPEVRTILTSQPRVPELSFRRVDNETHGPMAPGTLPVVPLDRIEEMELDWEDEIEELEELDGLDEFDVLEE
jgi:hypothetical protein